MTNSFSQFGMCVAMRGVEGGGLVTGLPVHNFYTDEGDVTMKCPTEVPITDRREKELADLGFAPAGALQGHRLCGVFQRAVRAEAETVRHRFGQRQCAPLDADSVHHGGFPFRALPEGDDARQDRKLHVAYGSGDLPEPLDHEVRGAGRHGIACDEGASARCVKRAWTWSRFPENPARTGLSHFYGRTSSWKNSAFRCGSWPIYRPQQNNAGPANTN